MRFMQKVCIKSVIMRVEHIRYDAYHIGFCFVVHYFAVFVIICYNIFRKRIVRR